MGKKNILQIMLFCSVLCIFVACEQDSSNQYFETTRGTNKETAPLTETINPRTHPYEEIEIGWFAEKIVFGNEFLWVLKPGQLIRLNIQEPHKQDIFDLPSSLGGDDILFDGQYLWTTSTKSDSSSKSHVFKFDLEKEIVTNETIVFDPISLAFGKNIIWISDFSNWQIIKLDAHSSKYLGTIPLDFASQKIGFGDDKVWAINTQDNEVSVFNTQNGEKIATYTTGKVPLDIAFDNDRVWIINRDDNYLTYVSFSLPTSSEKLPIQCPAQPTCDLGDIAITDAGTFVSSAQNNVVYKIDLGTGQILDKYMVRVPVDLAYDGSHIWVINGDRSRTDIGHTITRIKVTPTE